MKESRNDTVPSTGLPAVSCGLFMTESSSSGNRKARVYSLHISCLCLEDTPEKHVARGAMSSMVLFM